VCIPGFIHPWRSAMCAHSSRARAKRTFPDSALQERSVLMSWSMAASSPAPLRDEIDRDSLSRGQSSRRPLKCAASNGRRRCWRREHARMATAGARSSPLRLLFREQRIWRRQNTPGTRTIKSVFSAGPRGVYPLALDGFLLDGNSGGNEFCQTRGNFLAQMGID
jgi:hypothetical protein